MYLYAPNKHTTIMTSIFELEMKVRDYECDMQGVVNNANYQHYFEHARHEYMASKGPSFSTLHEQGIDIMVARIEIKYRHSLRSGDRFVVRLNMKREGIKLIIFHELYNLPGQTLCAKATVDAIIVDNGKLTRGELFGQLFGEELEKQGK